MFVLGCHRSGTSMLANLIGQLLQDCNQTKPTDFELLPGNPENPQGFFESRLLVETNEYLLQLVDASWDRPFLTPPCWSSVALLDKLAPLRERFLPYQHEPWVDKDPRLCLLWNAYRYLLLREPTGFLIIRDPLLVAGSLSLRNGFSGEKSALIWWLYHYHLLVSATAENVFCIDDSALIARDTFTVNAMADFIERHHNIACQTDTLMSLIEMVCRPELRRAEPLKPDPHGLLEQAHDIWSQWKNSPRDTQSLTSLFEHLPSLLLERYAQEINQQERFDNQTGNARAARELTTFNKLEQKTDAADLISCALDANRDINRMLIQDQRDMLTDLKRSLESAQNMAKEQSGLVGSLTQELLESRKAVQDLELQLCELRSSSSWRLTTPLRMIGMTIKKLIMICRLH